MLPQAAVTPPSPQGLRTLSSGLGTQGFCLGPSLSKGTNPRADLG